MGTFYTRRIGYTRRMLTAFLTLAISLPPATAATVSLNVLIDGKQVGEAKVSYRFTQRGTKLNQTRVDVKSSAGTWRMVQESEYDGEGYPIANSLRTVATANGKSKTDSVSISFAGRQATIRINRDGQLETKVSTAPEGKEIRRRDELWFLRTKPSVGQTFTCWHLDINRLQWRELKLQYIGQVDLPIHGKVVPAHHIKATDFDVWVDASGALLKIVNGSLKLIRK